MNKQKQITITVGDKAYTLEFTRATAADFMRQYEITDVIAKSPLATIPFVHAAFKSKHPTISRKKAEEIFDEIPVNQKTAFLTALMSMLNEVITSIVGDENGSDEGNAMWEQNWDGE